MDGPRALRATLRSVHPLLARPPPHFPSPYSTPLPPRLSPDYSNDNQAHLPSASSNFSSDRPPSTFRLLRPPPRSFSTTAGGGTARSVCSHLCPSRSSIPACTCTRLLPLRQHLPPCALRIDPPSPQAERAGTCRRPGRLPPPLPSLPRRSLVGGVAGLLPAAAGAAACDMTGRPLRTAHISIAMSVTSSTCDGARCSPARPTARACAARGR
jgi:hypothetical protein